MASSFYPINKNEIKDIINPQIRFIGCYFYFIHQIKELVFDMWSLFEKVIIKKDACIVIAFKAKFPIHKKLLDGRHRSGTTHFKHAGKEQIIHLDIPKLLSHSHRHWKVLIYSHMNQWKLEQW